MNRICSVSGPNNSTSRTRCENQIQKLNPNKGTQGICHSLPPSLFPHEWPHTHAWQHRFIGESNQVSTSPTLRRSKRTILEIMSRGGGPDGAAASSPPPLLESTSTFIMSLLSVEAMSASCAGGGWSSTSILLAGVGLLFWLRWFGNEKNDCLPFAG